MKEKIIRFISSALSGFGVFVLSMMLFYSFFALFYPSAIPNWVMPIVPWAIILASMAPGVIIFWLLLKSTKISLKSVIITTVIIILLLYISLLFVQLVMGISPIRTGEGVLNFLTFQCFSNAGDMDCDFSYDDDDYY